MERLLSVFASHNSNPSPSSSSSESLDSAEKTYALAIDEDADIKVAQLLSLGCSTKSATKLLTFFRGDISKAVLFYQNSLPFLVPACDSVVLEGAENAGNSCYVDSLIFALFARLDAFDWLLLPRLRPHSILQIPSTSSAYQYPNEDSQEEKLEAVQTSLRALVNLLRSGIRLSGDFINFFRSECVAAGWRSVNAQEDVSEFFLFLLNALQSPALPFKANIFHGAEICDSDISFVAEKVLVLSLLDMSEKAVPTLNDLLSRYFFDNRISGIMRKESNAEIQRLSNALYSISSEKHVDAWRMLRLLPFYTSNEEDPQRLRQVDEKKALHGAGKIILPILLKRFDLIDKQIIHCSKNVLIPSTLDVTKYLDDAETSSGISFTLHLRSVVCHLGNSIECGHYVAYTAQQPSTPAESTAWLKLDDLSSPCVTIYKTLEQISHVFYEEVGKTSYLLLYELKCADTSTTASDLEIAEQLQAEELEMEEKLLAKEHSKRRQKSSFDLCLDNPWNDVKK